MVLRSGRPVRIDTRILRKAFVLSPPSCSTSVFRLRWDRATPAGHRIRDGAVASIACAVAPPLRSSQHRVAMSNNVNDTTLATQREKVWVRLTLPLHQDQPGSTYSVMAQVARGTAGEVLIATVVHIQLKHVSGRHLTAAEFVVVSKGVEVARNDHPDKDGDGDTKDTPICIFVREQWATEQEAKQARFVAPACVRPQWPRTSAVARPPCSHLSPHGHLPPPQPELQPQRHYNIGTEVGVYSGIAHRRMLRFPGGPLGL